MSTEKVNTTTSSTNPKSELTLFDLQPKEQRFINLYMTGQYSIVKLGQLLEVHPSTLQRWLKRDDIKLAMNEAQGEIQTQVNAQLKSLTLKATNKLMELVDSPIDAVALQAVKDVLDRGGHKARQEIKVEKTITTVEQKMKELIEATVLDAEFEEVEND